MATDFDDVKDPGRKTRTKASDKVNVFSFPKGIWSTHRFVGGLVAYGRYWITSKNKEGKTIRYSVPCPSFDPKTQERDSTIADPWRDAEAVLRAQLEASGANKKGKKGEQPKSPIQFTVEYYINSIDRKAQKRFDYEANRPTKAEVKAGFKLKDEDSATPLVAVRLSRSLAAKIKALKSLNIDQDSDDATPYAVNHPKYGVDVRILYDDTKAPADQYQVIPRETRSPLKKEERALLLWNLEGLEDDMPAEEHITEFKRWAKVNEFDLDEINLGGSKKKPTRKSRDEDEDEDDEDFEDEDDSKKKPAAKKPTRKSRDEDEDDDFDDEDEDEDDEDEDEDRSSKKKPAAKKPAAKKPAAKKRPSDEDDEDEDDEDEDDDFDDDDEDDEDDEDESTSKKKPAKKKPAAKSKRKPADDDDDEDDDDDFDDEDDEDNEPPAKKKPAAKKAPAKKPAAKSKRKPVDEDEDDEDDDDIPF